MATHTTHPAAPVGSPAGTEAEPFLQRTVEWAKAHRQITTWIVGAILLGLVLFVWTASSNRRSEEVAGRELQGARFAFENQNLPLAASELARITENYSGTRAAEEGRLLLAQVRLLQGQPQQALEILRDYAPSAGKDFRAQAYGLLGATYENLGRPLDASQAYQDGSEAARLDFLKAQMLSDAGRALVIAGDTTKAIATYRRILADFENEASAVEAKVRLGELTKGAL